MRKITLQDIAGYITPRNVYELLCLLSSEEHSGMLSSLRLADIQVEEHFKIDKCKMKAMAVDEACEVWHLGALVFYAVMGIEVFEGKGMEWQTAEMPVPRIPTSYDNSSGLSNMIYRCLNYNADQRPTMKEIHDFAKTQLQKREEHSGDGRRRRALTSSTGRSYEESLVKFWPEEMVLMMIFFLLVTLPQSLFAQENKALSIPDEMTTIVNRCVSLRSSKNVKRVTSEFENDLQWTLLDEIAIDRKGECTTKDPVTMFGINSIGARILKHQSGAVNMGGRFRNGQDPRYKYSFIEVTVKKGATVTYEITKRKGTQMFAVVPYVNGAAFNVSVKQGNSLLGTSRMKDGVCYVSTNKRLALTDKFTISIVNTSGKNMSFVIVNYNSRN